MKRYIVVFLALLAGACARPERAPGGDPDRAPPGLVSTSPAALSTITDLQATAVFRFDERLRVRSFNRTFVSVSPGEPADFEVRLRGSEIRVRRTGGWLPGVIYHLQVRPGIEDRFGNKRTEPVELVFSTGPEIPPTAIAGIVQERLTGQPARDALIEAVRRTDTLAYRTALDSGAFFAIRHAPYGAYDVRAFQDRNRNARVDPGEPSSHQTLIGLNPGQDTITLSFELLPGDTTGPRLLRAAAMDSLHVRLTFDDAIDAEFGTEGAAVELFRQPDSVAVPMEITVLLGRAFSALPTRTPVDTAAADTAMAADTTAAGRDTAAAQAQARREPERLLPEANVVATLGQPIPPGDYIVAARGFRNVNGLTGGGSARFTLEKPRPPAPDTVRTPPDSTGAAQRTGLLSRRAGRRR